MPQSARDARRHCRYGDDVLADHDAAFSYARELLVGDLVRLRGTLDDDLPTLARWMMDPQIRSTQSNIVLVPTTVQTKHGDMLYTLKANQFVVEDNGVPQAVHLDTDTDSLGL